MYLTFSWVNFFFQMGGRSVFESMRRVRLVSDARELVRPVCIYVVAISVAVAAMVIAGNRLTTAAMALMVVGFAGAMVFQIHWAVGRLRSQSQTTRDSASRAEEHYVNVLRRIVMIVEASDRYRRGHSHRVGRMAEQIARKLKLPEEHCRMLGLAGQLHDIGLLAVPDGVLKKQADFGVANFRTVQKHSEVSFELLQPLESLAEVLPAIRYHHERLNGTGYPDGLAGEKIPLGARILAVADAYDAMTHDRPQRHALAPMPTMDELRRCTPSGYDVKCVDALAEIINLPELKQIMAGEEMRSV
jgi:HD-GYP domain-containing protein (c-di-GMP phosphodiesterase class II)